MNRKFESYLQMRSAWRTDFFKQKNFSSTFFLFERLIISRFFLSKKFTYKNTSPNYLNSVFQINRDFSILHIEKDFGWKFWQQSYLGDKIFPRIFESQSHSTRDWKKFQGWSKMKLWEIFSNFGCQNFFKKIFSQKKKNQHFLISTSSFKRTSPSPKSSKWSFSDLFLVRRMIFCFIARV